MNKISKSLSSVKSLSVVAASLFMFAGAPSAEAASYSVYARFADGGPQHETVFNGKFDWDGTTVSNFTGYLTESMWMWNGTTFSNMMGSADGYTGDVYAKPGGYAMGDAPMLKLTFDSLVPASNNGGIVTATTFLKNTTDVVMGGGYNIDTNNGGNAMAYGMPDQNARTNNAFFTLAFNAADPFNTAGLANQIQYADMTALGMMGPLLTGWMGMTGIDGGGSMGGQPTALFINEVPVPAAAWLFGGALLSLFGANRRKSVLPA